MKLLARAVLPVAAGALLLSGCTSTQPGTASPAGSPSAASSAGESSSADPGSASTTSLEPCTLLTASDVSAYNTFEAPEEKKLGGARLCSYRHNVTDASEESMTINVGIRDDAPLDSVNDTGNGVKDIDVNGRKAKEASSTTPLGCTVALGVGDKSRVDVNVISVKTVEKACQVAEEVATKAVEPKLPKA
ncbi:DUF3558 domain-containing protein [Amycolatopsis sp. FBCC-B4732]|uniref:DUF3558 domain-containing protein n=1 Tax=Amycolatopsis sp. FBCC-B4732 TaxID=3079339 RepID=UPI001FF3C0AC|nr:DUF3558 domain-containing protein [Amycolatopsis sp. FBCC-B4732]UOX86994.1 DUF3558 domain-containing protein [Amycolatopsis sp. FBCC-B4732]